MLYPVILSGGSGERLWPASKPHRPKPFLPLVGQETPFEQALGRAAALPGAAPPTIVAGAAHEASIRDTLDGREATLILEPRGRDTAPAMAAAAMIIGARDPEAVLLFMPADHFLPDIEPFMAHAGAMAASARTGAIAIMGLTPTHPSTAYGYVLPEPGSGVPCRVMRFVEKPDLDEAEALIELGALWNAGIFVARADVLVEALLRHAPVVLCAVDRAITQARRTGDAVRLSEAFSLAPSIAFDVAVMQATEDAVVHPAALRWSDLGGWSAVLAASERDAHGNSAAGEVVLESASDCLVRAADGMTVAVVGARNLAVIVDQDGVMICDLASGDQVRSAIRRVSAGRR